MICNLKINIKKMLLLVGTGTILINNTGCYNDNITVEKEINLSTEQDITTEYVEEQNDLNNYDEQELISYFNDLNEEIDEIINEENIDQGLEKIGDIVATMIGFIWYGEEIKGITFDELSKDTKEIILDIYYKVDAKIENKIPDYKENIKDKYEIISKFIKDKYDDIKYNVDIWLEEKLGEENYNDLKEETKKNFNESVEDMEEVADFYKEKVNNWYQKKKSK